MNWVLGSPLRVRRHSWTLLAALLLAPALVKGEDPKVEPAIDGYCPASYLLSGAAKKGDPQHQSTHDGKLYYFADSAAKAAFDADPAKYLPQFSGLCTTSLGGRFGNRIVTDPKVFAVVEGKVYLFSSERARIAYDRTPQEYIKTAGERFAALPVEQRIPDPQYNALKGAPVPPKSAAPPRPSQTLVGAPVPPAVFTAPDGTKITTPEMTDSATLLMFYTSWCGFCKKALPQLDVINKSMEGKSARILAISMDSLKESGATDARAVSRQEVLDQFKTLGVSLPQAFDSRGDAKNNFKVASFPTMFLIDKAGIVQRVYSGISAVTDGSLKQAMEDLLAGKRLPPQEVPVVQAGPQTMQGQPAPQGTFTSAAAGAPYSLAQPGADATVAFFYASWCGYCKKALPELSSMAKAYDGQPVRFVGISQDTLVDKPDPANARAKTKDDVMQQWRDMGIAFDQMLDPSGVGRQGFKVQSYPTMFLIDKGGKIRKVYVGATSVTDGTLKKEIDAVLAGNPS